MKLLLFKASQLRFRYPYDWNCTSIAGSPHMRSHRRPTIERQGYMMGDLITGQPHRKTS